MVVYLCVYRGVDFASFYDFDILFWNCTDRMVFLTFFNYYRVNISKLYVHPMTRLSSCTHCASVLIVAVLMTPEDYLIGTALVILAS